MIDSRKKLAVVGGRRGMAFFDVLNIFLAAAQEMGPAKGRDLFKKVTGINPMEFKACTKV